MRWNVVQVMVWIYSALAKNSDFKNTCVQIAAYDYQVQACDPSLFTAFFNLKLADAGHVVVRDVPGFAEPQHVIERGTFVGELWKEADRQLRARLADGALHIWALEPGKIDEVELPRRACEGIIFGEDNAEPFAFLRRNPSERWKSPRFSVSEVIRTWPIAAKQPESTLAPTANPQLKKRSSGRPKGTGLEKTDLPQVIAAIELLRSGG